MTNLLRPLVIASGLVAATLGAGVSGNSSSRGLPPSRPQGQLTPAAVLDAARTALGGASRLAAVRSLTWTAESRLFAPTGQQVSVDQLAVEFEPPTKFLRTLDRSIPPSTETEGFDGERLIEVARSRDPSMAVFVLPRTPAQRAWSLRNKRQLATRLLLACCLSDRTPAPVRFTAVARVMSPDGDADALEVTGPEGFSATIFLDATTHRPVMFEYGELTVRRARGPRASC